MHGKLSLCGMIHFHWDCTASNCMQGAEKHSSREGSARHGGGHNEKQPGMQLMTNRFLTLALTAHQWRVQTKLKGHSLCMTE